MDLIGTNNKQASIWFSSQWNPSSSRTILNTIDQQEWSSDNNNSQEVTHNYYSSQQLPLTQTSESINITNLS